jgi:YD repeat-containing protein
MRNFHAESFIDSAFFLLDMDRTMQIHVPQPQTSLRLKAIAKHILALLPLLAMTDHAHATIYVQAKKVYLGGSGYFTDSGAAANSYAKEHCSGTSVQHDCSGRYVSEAYDPSISNWWWKGTETYLRTDYNPPNPPIVTSYSVDIGNFISFECPTGFTTYDLPHGSGLCSAPDKPDPPPPPPDCSCNGSSSPPSPPNPGALPSDPPLEPDSVPSPNPSVGNPILPSTGVKEQTDTDYSNALGTLSFVRTYRSNNKRWEHNYQSFAAGLSAPTASAQNGAACVLAVSGSSKTPYCYPYASVGSTNDIGVRRPGGSMLYFSSGNSFKPRADINDRVSPLLDGGGIQTGWKVVNGQTDAVENYDLNGLLLSSTSRNGRITTYTYSDANTPPAIAPSPGLLLVVTDVYGHHLSFTYASTGLMNSMTDPAGGIYQYAYDAKNNLTSVTYPDGKVRRYVYNEPANTGNTDQPFALTGIIDENNSRYATFKYASYGPAISTEHAAGTQKFSLSYPYANQQTVVTDPLGTNRTYNFINVLGVIKNSGITKPAPTGSGTVSTSLSYDANGNISSTTDFNGNRTTYTYDLTRNLELTRIEAAGTAYSRTITTSWHATWRLPLQIAEPKRRTTFTYDANGNVLTKSVQATSDATGTSGFSAALVGSARVWTYTYNQFGQLLTEKGPRTDVNDLTSYIYDEFGNLASITNAAGHTTTMSGYDANGRVGRITDPNGLVTDFTYTPRGWLSSRTVGGENTSYTYDDAGQMTRVTLPDNSTISYTYDVAHRLTNIVDSLGNSIVYTLDLMGNRTVESMNDPGGVLSRKTTRVYDALNNVKQQTGGAQ